KASAMSASGSASAASRARRRAARLAGRASSRAARAAGSSATSVSNHSDSDGSDSAGFALTQGILEPGAAETQRAIDGAGRHVHQGRDLLAFHAGEVGQRDRFGGARVDGRK